MLSFRMGGMIANMETDSQPVDKKVKILFEDDGLLVVNKPGNLPCHPGGSYLENTLLHVLRGNGYETLYIMNRLDRETSGIVLLAKNQMVAKSLSNQFKNHTVRKEYTVLIHGEFPEEMSVSGWLVHDDNSAIVKKRHFVQCEEKPTERAEFAETEFKRISYNSGISRLKVFPKTGRTHQIRATLYSLGFPVVGDKIYGLDETIFLRFISDTMTDADRERLIYARQALHASSLAVMYRNEKRTFVCEPDF